MAAWILHAACNHPFASLPPELFERALSNGKLHQELDALMQASETPGALCVVSISKLDCSAYRFESRRFLQSNGTLHLSTSVVFSPLDAILEAA